MYEVNLENPNRPFYQKSYFLAADEGNFLSIDVLSANSKFIITHFFSIKDMKPVIRIFKRDSSFFNLGYAQFNYIDFMDSGVYLQFLAYDDNYFLLKTSGDFRIMKIQH